MAKLTPEIKATLEKIGNDKQTAQILRYMATHKKGITSIDAFQLFYATRLSGIVYNLRHTYNLEIITEEEVTKKGTRYARYKLVA